jgi:hypothetical protein
MSLISVLERSVKKNGEIPLTNLHLLNILKLVELEEVAIEEQTMKEYFDASQDFLR